MSFAQTLSTTSVPSALYSTVNSLVGLDEMLYCSGAHSFWGGQMHCTVQFAMAEMRQQYSTGGVSFGNTATFRIPRAGDQVYWVYAVVQLPGIQGISAEDLALGTGGSLTAAFPSWEAAGGPYGIQERGCEDIVVDQDDGITRYIVAGGDRTNADEYLLKYGIGAQARDFLFQYAPSLPTVSGSGDAQLTPEQAVYESLFNTASSANFLPTGLQHWAAWTNAVGFRLIEFVKFKIGTQTIVEFDFDYMFAHEELAGRPGKRLEEMVGKRSGSVPNEVMDELIVDSLATRYLYVPLPFWFTKAPSHTLSMLHLTLATAEVEIRFAQLSNLIVRKDANTIVQRVGQGGQGRALAENDLSVVLSTTHIWLPQEERNRLQATGTEKIQIIQQVQKFEQQATSISNSLRLDFNMPTLELVFFVRRRCRERINDWFNYSGIAGLDTVDNVKLTVNNNVYINSTEGTYFRLVKPFQQHRLIPKAHIYCIPFALFPDEMLISGSLNFSRYDSIILDLQLQRQSVGAGTGNDGVIHVYGPNFNTLLYRSGGATVVFS
jgi:hypothetical protein